MVCVCKSFPFCVDKLPTLLLQISIGMTHCRNHFFKEHLVNNMWEKEKLREKKREKKKTFLFLVDEKKAKKKRPFFLFLGLFSLQKVKQVSGLYLLKVLDSVRSSIYLLINQIIPFQGSVHKRRSDWSETYFVATTSWFARCKTWRKNCKSSSVWLSYNSSMW